MTRNWNSVTWVLGGRCLGLLSSFSQHSPVLNQGNRGNTLEKNVKEKERIWKAYIQNTKRTGIHYTSTTGLNLFLTQETIASSLIGKLLAQEDVVNSAMTPSNNAEETSKFVAYTDIND
jgi:hypothetical protein